MLWDQVRWVPADSGLADRCSARQGGVSTPCHHLSMICHRTIRKQPTVFFCISQHYLSSNKSWCTSRNIELWLSLTNVNTWAQRAWEPTGLRETPHPWTPEIVCLRDSNPGQQQTSGRHPEKHHICDGLHLLVQAGHQFYNCNQSSML